MDLVLKNPYRILGLLVGTSAAKQKEQTKRLKRFLDGDLITLEDFSFPKIGNLSRSNETLMEAASKLDSNHKINASLFWYYMGNPLADKAAFNEIISGNFDKVLNIWSDLISNNEVTRLNASAYNNLSTFYLSGISEGSTSYEDRIKKGIILKLKFLESDFIRNLIKLAPGGTFEITKKELQLIFLNELQSEFKNNEIIDSGKLIDLIMSQEFSAKKDFLKLYSQRINNEIESKIKEAKKKSKENKILAGEYGNELYDSTQNQLIQLCSLLGLADPDFILISDKLANGILQCSISLFNHFHNTDTEVDKIALELNRKAETIALGNLTRDRIKESTKIVRKYIKDGSTREKLRKVKKNLNFIQGYLEKFQLKEHTISNAVHFANECKPLLKSLKLKLGADDKIYSIFSTVVAYNAQSMIFSIAQKAVEKRNNYVKYYNCLNDPFCRLSIFLKLENSSSSDVPYSPEYSYGMLRKVISDAWKATVDFGSFDMSRKEKINYNKNKDLLLELHKQLNPVFLYFKNTSVDKFVMQIIGFAFL